MRSELEKIIGYFGVTRQIEKFSCEVSELSLAIHRFKENPSSITVDNMTDEIADVMNLMDQIILKFGLDHEIEMIRSKKIERTIRKIDEEKELVYDKSIADEVF